MLPESIRCSGGPAKPTVLPSAEPARIKVGSATSSPRFLYESKSFAFHLHG
jgi:hypothetical protein